MRIALALFLIASATSCTLISEVDRSKIDDAPGGAGPTAGSGGSNGGAMTGGSDAGGAGTGGTQATGGQPGGMGGS